MGLEKEITFKNHKIYNLELNALKKTNNIDKDKYYISRTKVSKDASSVNKSKINLTTVDEMIYK